MSVYSERDLERMLFEVESDLVERKESFKGDGPTKAREAACAFANDLPGRGRPGVLFIGARDDGSPSGLTVTDELLLQLAEIKTDGNIVPPPTLTVAKHVLRGNAIAVVTVWPADAPPVRYKGRVYIRIGPRRGIATAQDERILNEKRRHGDRPFDVRPGTAVPESRARRCRARRCQRAISARAAAHRPAIICRGSRARHLRLQAGQEADFSLNLPEDCGGQCLKPPAQPPVIDGPALIDHDLARLRVARDALGKRDAQ